MHKITLKAKLDRIYGFVGDLINIYGVSIYATIGGQWAMWIDDAQRNLSLPIDYEWHTWTFTELEDGRVQLQRDDRDITIFKKRGDILPITLGNSQADGGHGSKTKYDTIAIDEYAENFHLGSGSRWDMAGTGMITVSNGLLVCDSLAKAGTAWATRRHYRTLEVTTIATCPVNCARYCPQDVLKIAYKGCSLLTLANFKKALSHVPKDVQVHFSGYGEPFLNPFAKDMIIHAHNEGYDIALYTTLSNIKLETYEAMKHVPFEIICIHLPDVDGITKIKITPDYLAILKSLKQMPNASFMSMGEISPKVREVLPNYSYAFENIERAGNCQGVKPRRKMGKLFCYKLERSQFVMLPDCTVTLCCMDYGMKHRLGNLLLDKYDDLVNSEEMEMVLKSVNSLNDSYALCRRCKISDTNLMQTERPFRSYLNLIQARLTIRHTF